MSFLNKKKASASASDPTDKIGKDLSFAATEAYKRLRANLLLSFTSDASCRIVGVTSSLRGEGKSTTSVNLAYTLAEMGKNVLILDSDMRLPNVHRLLKLNQSPGLSNLLSGGGGSNIIQPTALHRKLYAITAGDIPPNPTELLSSRRMENTLQMLSQNFDFIIIDLPPIDAVSDALIVSKYTSGMIMVVRQNYVDKRALDNSVRQLRYHKAQILGFVMNGADPDSGYYKKGYYKKDGTYEYRSKSNG